MINQLLYHRSTQAKIDALTRRSAFHCDEYLISWDGSSGIGIDKQRRCIGLVGTDNRPIYFLRSEILAAETQTDSHQETRRSHLNMWGRYYLYKWAFGQHKANAAVLTGRVKTITVVDEVNLIIKVKNLNRPVHQIRIVRNGGTQQVKQALITASTWETYLATV